MSLTESEKFPQANLTAVPDPSIDAMYLDSQVVLEQRGQAEIVPDGFAPPKQAKQFTMIPNTSSDSLYLDSNVALGQRRQSEIEMEANEAAFQQAERREGEGTLTGMRHQLDAMAPGGSILEFGNSIGAAAQVKLVAAKDTLMEGALPAAQEAIRTVRCHIRSISGGSNEVEETVPDDLSPKERECIDKMSNEQICDFLREKNMSNKRPLPTK